MHQDASPIVPRGRLPPDLSKKDETAVRVLLPFASFAQLAQRSRKHAVYSRRSGDHLPETWLDEHARERIKTSLFPRIASLVAGKPDSCLWTFAAYSLNGHKSAKTSNHYIPWEKGTLAGKLRVDSSLLDKVPATYGPDYLHVVAAGLTDFVTFHHNGIAGSWEQLKNAISNIGLSPTCRVWWVYPGALTHGMATRNAWVLEGHEMLSDKPSSARWATVADIMAYQPSREAQNKIFDLDDASRALLTDALELGHRLME